MFARLYEWLIDLCLTSSVYKMYLVLYTLAKPKSVNMKGIFNYAPCWFV